MKKIFTLIASFSLSIFSFSQKEKNIWYFGNNAGLDFNSGTPVVLTNGVMFTYDNCTSVSDNSTGSLLYYSNGVDVWNKNHNVMPNGSGLLGNTSGGNSAFAVRQPGNTSIYYLFTNDAFAGPNGLRYSIIDMSLNGGLGDVTSTKNVMLLNPSTEKIAAVKHSNGQDIWIIAHPWNSNSFYAYLLSSTGLNTTPVVSTIGSTHAGGTYNAMGQISATQQGNKLVVAIYDLQVYELFDFDRNTGALSNLITISGYPNAWGAEFSPDGKKLYTTQWTYSVVYQFDLTSNNQATINNSAMVIGTATSPDPNYKAGYLQIGPDQKIYVAKFTSDYLGVISSPNTLGISCNFLDNGVYLAGKICEAGFPSFLQTNLLLVSVNTATVCPSACTTLNATPSGGTLPYTYLWSTAGQTTSSITVCPTSTTNYTISVTDATGNIGTGITTVTVTSSPSVNAGTDVTITIGQSTNLVASGGGVYIWSNGAWDSLITVSPSATTVYCVTVTNANNCSDSDCITVTVIPEPVIDCSSFGELYLPNVFSPNADSENDVLQIYYRNFSCIESFNITIYNRWGEKIFESSDPEFQWDGSYRGKKLDSGVFAYYIQSYYGKKIERKGNVSILK